MSEGRLPTTNGDGIVLNRVVVGTAVDQWALALKHFAGSDAKLRAGMAVGAARGVDTGRGGFDEVLPVTPLVFLAEDKCPWQNTIFLKALGASARDLPVFPADLGVSLVCGPNAGSCMEQTTIKLFNFFF